MLIRMFVCLIGVIAVAGSVIGHAGEPVDKNPLVLWYPAPAQEWNAALPIGNGRLGAMVFSGVPEERLQFNEDTCWTGKPHEYQHEGAVKFLPELRKLLAEGKQKEAEALAMKEFMSVPLRQMAYQPFGDILLTFPGHEKPTDYRRELDLDSAVARVSYKVDGVVYERQVFASFPDQAIIVRLTAGKRGKLTFTARPATPHKAGQIDARGDDLLMTWKDGNLIEAALRSKAGAPCKVRYGGKVIELKPAAGERVRLDGTLKTL